MGLDAVRTPLALITRVSMEIFSTLLLIDSCAGAVGLDAHGQSLRPSSNRTCVIICSKSSPILLDIAHLSLEAIIGKCGAGNSSVQK